MQNVMKLIKCTLGLGLFLTLSVSLSPDIPPIFTDGGVMQEFVYEATIGLKDPSVWHWGTYPHPSSLRNIQTRQTRPIPD